MSSTPELTDTPATDEGAEDPAGTPVVVDRLFWGVLVAVLVPIAVAVVRAIRNDWVPLGDNGLFLIRSRDVLTSHTPLLGTWTSASLNTGSNFNHPGPLIFDLLALPTKLGGAAGLALGTAVINAFAVAGIGLMARRRGGPVVGIGALLVAALLCSSMGSELLYDPWNPHVVLLPFLFLLTCVWSLAAGDHVALPWAVGAASLIVQTHLSYAGLVAVLCGWGVVALGLAVRRDRAGDGWPARRRSLAKVGAVALLVAGLCWLQPLVEMATADGPGNLERLARNGATSDETIGVDRGTRIVADTATVPPLWLRPSFENALAYERLQRAAPGDLPSVDPSLPVAAALLAALGLLLAAAAWDARRRCDGTAVAALLTAGVALVAELVTAWRLPVGIIGVAAHQFRWMWPIAAFGTLAVLAYALRRGADTPGRARGTAIALGVLAVAVAVSTVPFHNVRSGPVSDADAMPTLRAAMAQMGAIEGQGTILVDVTGIRFAEPYTATLMAELQSRGIPFTVENEGMVRQLGEGRRETGEARQRLLFREGDAARVGLPGARRVVYVEGLTATEQDERADLRAAAVDHLVTEGVVTRDLDEARLPGNQLAAIPTGPAPAREAVESLLNRGTLTYLVDNDFLVVDAPWKARLERLADLERRWARHTLGLFLAPIAPAGGP